MRLRVGDFEQSAEALTEEAFEAAEGGYWARVQSCYDRRQMLLAQHVLSSVVAHRLYHLDRQIYEKASAAQGGIEQHLRDVRARREALRRLASAGEVQRRGGRYLDDHV